MDKNLSERKLQKLIQKTLLYGVILSCIFLFGGLLLSVSGAEVFSQKLMLSGILILIFTPVARVTMLVYGFILTKEYAFAAASLTVLFFLLVSFTL